DLGANRHDAGPAGEHLDDGAFAPLDHASRVGDGVHPVSSVTVPACTRCRRSRCERARGVVGRGASVHPVSSVGRVAQVSSSLRAMPPSSKGAPKGPTPAAAKTERLLNLVIALLSTRQPLSRARIREAVPAYSDNDEAFERMFERDKDELRALGIPLRTEPIDPFFDDEPGYRIDQREYALPELAFEPDELAVVGLASRAWSQASLAGPAAQALRKLEAAGLVRDESS